MYYYLNGALKRRLILELKNSFAKHPIYEKIVPYIQDRMAFTERPQYGIVLKGVNADKVQLSADNFIAQLNSRTMLCFYDKPAYPLEWVREDTALLQANSNVMPTVPGVYYIEILDVPKNDGEFGLYIIDPLLDVTQEPILIFQSGVETQGQLQVPPLQGTVRLYQNLNYLLTENVDYSIDYVTGAVTFLTPFPPGSRVTANYRYPTESIGPKPFAWNSADAKTLPGVVLAFGKRARIGDKVAVVVTQDTSPTARIFGGKWELTYELDVISQDPIQREEITDWAMIYLWVEKRPFLSLEGIEMTSISMGGESEEPMDETGDIMMYSASFSVSIQADWEMHIPYPFTISKLQPVTAQGTVPSPDAASGTAGIIGSPSNLVFATLPLFMGRNSDFERII